MSDMPISSTDVASTAATGGAARKVTVAVMGDFHGAEVPEGFIPEDIDALFYAGDFALQIKPQANFDAQIKAVEHVQSLPGKVKVAVGGNHDDPISYATGWDHLSRFGGSDGPKPRPDRYSHLTEDHLHLLRDTIKTQTLPNGDQWNFVEHGLLRGVSIGGHTFDIFASSLSHLRGMTSAYTFKDENTPNVSQLWQEIRSGAHIVMTHGPMRDYLSRSQAGEPILDRDGCQYYQGGSDSLRAAVDAAKPGLVISAHLHKSHGHKTIPYSASGSAPRPKLQAGTRG